MNVKGWRCRRSWWWWVQTGIQRVERVELLIQSQSTKIKHDSQTLCCFLMSMTHNQAFSLVVCSHTYKKTHLQENRQLKINQPIIITWQNYYRFAHRKHRIPITNNQLIIGSSTQHSLSLSHYDIKQAKTHFLFFFIHQLGQMNQLKCSCMFGLLASDEWDTILRVFSHRYRPREVLHHVHTVSSNRIFG